MAVSLKIGLTVFLTMKKDPRYDIEMMQKNKLKLSDSFAFDCSACGKCCRNREDILLSPHDMFRAAKHLNLQPKQFFEKYCETYIGHMSKCPAVRLKPKSIYNNLLLREPQIQGTVCPLLSSNGQCSIHLSKPTSCAIFPLGKFHSEGDKTVSYYLQSDIPCGDKSKRQSLKEWLTKFDIFHTEEMMIVWTSFLNFAVKVLKEIDTFAQKTKDLTYTLYLNILYFNYNFEEKFLPQLKANIATFEKLMKPLELMKSQVEDTE